jgi:hypothetical protein
MVTTTGSREYTPYALRSFFATTPWSASDRFVLVDNDGDFVMPDDLRAAPIVLMKNASPKSFAANANAALALAAVAEEPVVLLNNDVIFTAHWFDSFGPELSFSILVPLCNREFQYRAQLSDAGGAVSFPQAMSLSGYLGREHIFASIAEQHRERLRSDATYLDVVYAPFFVVSIPPRAFRSIGAFDERFGIGGAEDFDYCIRAHLAGVRVRYVQPSFLLHFGNKSFESEGGQGRTSHEQRYIVEFALKWGENIRDLCFAEDPDILGTLGVSAYDFQQFGYKNLIEGFLPSGVVPEIFRTLGS